MAPQASLTHGVCRRRPSRATSWPWRVVFPSRGNHRRGNSSAVLAHRKPCSLHIRGCIGTRLRKNSRDFLQKSEHAMRFPSRRPAPWAHGALAWLSFYSRSGFCAEANAVRTVIAHFAKAHAIRKDWDSGREQHSTAQLPPGSERGKSVAATARPGENDHSRSAACRRADGIPRLFSPELKRHLARNRSGSGNLPDASQRFRAAF